MFYAEIVAPQAESAKYFQIWFYPDLGEGGGKGNGGVLNMRMQVILDSLFARPGSTPIQGGAGRKESSGTGTSEAI